jgi:hypothetical protein
LCTFNALYRKVSPLLMQIGKVNAHESRKILRDPHPAANRLTDAQQNSPSRMLPHDPVASSTPTR